MKSIALSFLLMIAVALGASAQSGPATIVLVHGAFADGSSWSKVIPILQGDGYYVIAVQNPLTSFAEDVATTRRVIESQKGPVIVVGHSYGGPVITEAAAGNPNVKALVYVAAFAPAVGETIGEATAKFAPSALGTALVPDSAGFLYIDRAKFREVFAADASEADVRVIAATQKPAHNSLFGAPITKAAYETVPSYYVITTQDKAINPELMRAHAKRIGAKVTEVKSSHVPFWTQPKAVARVIEEAARQTTPRMVASH